MSLWADLKNEYQRQATAQDAREKIARMAVAEGQDPETILQQVEAMLLSPRADWYFAKLRTTTDGFFVPAAMLGFVWSAYRKMYEQAIISALGFGFAIAFIAAGAQARGNNPERAGIIVLFALAAASVASGFNGGRAIRYHTKRRLQVVARKASNLTDLSYHAKLRGGSNPVAPVLAVLPVFFGMGIGINVALWAFPDSGMWSGGLAEAPARGPARPACVLLSGRLEEASFRTAEGPDFGFNYHVEFRNDGAAGEVLMVAEMTSSEGRFVRRQNYAVQAGARHVVSFQFHEPTMLVANVRADASCVPQAPAR